MKSVRIVYFSGTGSSRYAVSKIKMAFEEKGVRVVVEEINRNPKEKKKITEDMLVLLAPVYGFRLVNILEKWVRNLELSSGLVCGILPVSGGGDISPNTACCVAIKRLLERKKIEVVYEDMITMPSNFAAQCEDSVNAALMACMENKALTIVHNILTGRRKSIHVHPLDYCWAWLGRGEHLGAKVFGRRIRVRPECTGCGKCMRECPQSNIRRVEGKPRFGWRCMWCMKCLYTCPEKALEPGIMKFSVIKSGYPLYHYIADGTKEDSGATQDYLNEISYPRLWQGVIDYIQENNGDK